MIAAVLTTEDGAFYKHHGFNHAAIRNSAAANLKARRFVRGASTITMQLAKNLFLSREKTLSRKIEEVILTDYLEQAFRKDDMMELYLNVIEFGPDVYGVTQAAEYYFGRKPEELERRRVLLPRVDHAVAHPLRKAARQGTGLRGMDAAPPDAHGDRCEEREDLARRARRGAGSSRRVRQAGRSAPGAAQAGERGPTGSARRGLRLAAARVSRALLLPERA